MVDQGEDEPPHAHVHHKVHHEQLVVSVPVLALPFISDLPVVSVPALVAAADVPLPQGASDGCVFAFDIQRNLDENVLETEANAPGNRKPDSEHDPPALLGLRVLPQRADDEAGRDYDYARQLGAREHAAEQHPGEQRGPNRNRGENDAEYRGSAQGQAHRQPHRPQPVAHRRHHEGPVAPERIPARKEPRRPPRPPRRRRAASEAHRQRAVGAATRDQPAGQEGPEH
mmetsp:Transcript_38437/g.89340  ORF Transcript_38437/g.89340 Transcript_38437/m.89340 type:complete len:228 (-) Transcript_38437:534-1217(-)